MITSLQIGSGKAEGIYRSPEWVNLDLVRHKKRGHFVVGDGCALPFRERYFQKIHAIHVLEHMPRDLHPKFIAEIKRTLAPGGEAFIEVPDFLEVCRTLIRAAERLDHEEVRIRTVGIYGKGRHFGDFHHWGWSPWYLEQKIREAGLECERSYDMISGHFRQEPVILMRAWRG